MPVSASATAPIRSSFKLRGTDVSIHLPATAKAPLPIAWLGAISYSLYLLHVPIGHRVISLIISWSGSRLIGFPVIMVALATSIAGAALLHRYVEQPALRLAARIGYGAKSQGDLAQRTPTMP